MSNGNHFTPGISLAATPSFTGSDADTAIAALQLAATRGLLFIGDTAPDSSNSPDWERFLWASAFNDNGTVKYIIKMYNGTEWLPVVTHVQDLVLSDIKATAADLGKIPVVVQTDVDVYTPQWTNYEPSNIPAVAITPGTANQIFVTNNAGTASVWSTLASLLNSLGRVVSLDNLTFGAATAGQVPTFTGSTIQWKTPATFTNPTADSLAWVTSNNNFQVWDTLNAKSVLKSRKQVVDTLPSEIPSGTINTASKVLAFSDTAGFTATVAELGAAIFANSSTPTVYSTPPGSEIAVPTDGVTSAGVPHGLGVAPKAFGGSILCITADANSGYAPGDILQLVNSWDTEGGRQQFFLRADATNLYVMKVHGEYVYLPTKTSGVTSAVSDTAHFKIRLWAMA